MNVCYFPLCKEDDYICSAGGSDGNGRERMVDTVYYHFVSRIWNAISWVMGVGRRVKIEEC